MDYQPINRTINDMNKTIIVLLALASASPALAQSASGHAGHRDPPDAADHAAHGQTAPQRATPPAPDVPTAHAMDCCKEDAAQPCQMPCCARMRQQAGADTASSSDRPAEHSGH